VTLDAATIKLLETFPLLARKILRAARDFFLREIRNALISRLPKFARACGRVSVGGHPDKRPDSRPE